MLLMKAFPASRCASVRMTGFAGAAACPGRFSKPIFVANAWVAALLLLAVGESPGNMTALEDTLSESVVVDA